MPALDTFFFYSFALLAVAGAVFTVAFRSAVHSAIALIVSLLGVAGLYLLQGAEFLFAVQIILYIGGIMLLFLFVIMLVNLDEAAQYRQFVRYWWVGLAALMVLGAEAFALVSRAPMPWATGPAANPSTTGNTEQLADILFSQYLLPFEAVSLLLLAAIVGSVFMARKGHAAKL